LFEIPAELWQISSGHWTRLRSENGLECRDEYCYWNDLDVGLSTRGLWVQILAKTQRGICEQDTLNPQLRVAIISRITCGTSHLSKK
jgi:hypothetical protein